MNNTSAALLTIFLLTEMTSVEAKIGQSVGKVALVNSPNWILIIIFSIGAVFMLSVIKEVFNDYENVTDKEEKTKGNFMKILFIIGFLGCLIIVFTSAFG